MYLFLEAPIGDLEEKRGRYNCWIFISVCYCHN